MKIGVQFSNCSFNICQDKGTNASDNIIINSADSEIKQVNYSASVCKYVTYCTYFDGCKVQNIIVQKCYPQCCHLLYLYTFHN